MSTKQKTKTTVLLMCRLFLAAVIFISFGMVLFATQVLSMSVK